MGNEMMRGNLLSNSQHNIDKTFNPHDRRWKKRPDPTKGDFLQRYKDVLYNWKHSNSEILYYMHRFCSGVLLGGLVSIVVYPILFRHSPYVAWKMIQTFKTSEFLPTASFQLIMRSFAPQYAWVGGVTAVVMQYLSDLFDRAIDANKMTKYGVLGAIDGGLFFAVFGNYNMWFPGMLGGLTIGLMYSAIRSRNIDYLFGDTGVNAVEYMPGVSKETIRKHKLQEARIVGRHNFK